MNESETLTTRARGRAAAVLGSACLVGALLAAGTPASATALEKPVTEAATGVTGTHATLHGELNPKASVTAGYYFNYNMGGTCTGGATTKPGTEATGQGIKVSAEAEELEPSTEYTFCVVAAHTETEPAEPMQGAPLKFRTLAMAPTAGRENAIVLTPFEATLEARINANNQETTYVFQYAPNSTLTGATTLAGASNLSGFGEREVTVTTGAVLAPGTTYYFRLIAENVAHERTEGPVQSFTTLPLEKPSVEGEGASRLTSTGARLEAQVNPRYQETTYAFEYAANEALAGATTVPGPAPLAAGGTAQSVGTTIDGLQPRTTYYYRALATNATGLTYGEPVQSFTTPAVAVVNTGEVEERTRTTATLSGTVNPSGAATTYHFAYIEQAGYEAAVRESAADPYSHGSSTPESSSVGSDFAAHAVGPVSVDELHPGTTYHCALVATNSVGTVIGPDVTFTTAARTPPISVTGEAVNVTPFAATLIGSVDTRELQTTVWFELGTTPYGGSVETATVIPGFESRSVAAISLAFGDYLQPGTTYYYRAVATNSDGTGYGTERSFTTGVLPAGAAITLPLAPAFIGYIPIAEPDAREHVSRTTGATASRKLRKLSTALKACKKDKSETKRAKCEKDARKRYGTRAKGR